MNDFYSETLRQLLKDGWLGLDSSVLVVCGERYDRDVFFAKRADNTSTDEAGGTSDEDAFHVVTSLAHPPRDLSGAVSAFFDSDAATLFAGDARKRAPAID